MLLCLESPGLASYLLLYVLVNTFSRLWKRYHYVTITSEELQNLGLGAQGFEDEGIFLVTHLL
jgi:hypothetical protein